MSVCKDCVHYELCKYNAYQEAHYFGKDKKIYISIDNNSACRFFREDTEMAYVSYGYWDWQHDGTHFCSECGTDALFNFEGEEFCSFYCPHCGAIMKEIKYEQG